MTAKTEIERRRRLEPDARRGQILACAVRLFGDQPFADVSITDVAREAGVARGLVNHYFGAKKDLYIEVIRVMVTIPPVAVEQLPVGDLRTRVDASVAWFLDTVSRHRASWLAAVAAGGMSHDPAVAQVLSDAEEVAADSVLTAVGFTDAARHREEFRAMIRAYGGMATSAAREWLQRDALDRRQVHSLLTTTLMAIVEQVFPAVRSGDAGSAPPSRRAVSAAR